MYLHMIRAARSLTFVALFLGINTSVAEVETAIRLNKTIDLLDRGSTALGLLAFDYSLDNARTLSRSDLDFVIIDMEHAPFDVERLREFLLGMTDKRAILDKGNLQPNVTPIVRIPATGGAEVITQVKQVLDVGVFGVMFPSVDNREEAEIAIKAMRYPQLTNAEDFEPRGLRGRNPANASWYWGIPDYHQKADVWPLDDAGELLAIIQIETPEGVENIDAILSVPGVGAIFIGPADLSGAMGYASASAPEVEAAIQTILSACLAYNVACAITTSSNSVEQRLAEGFTM
ncbi:MAG: aldolase/citrate lyase family protein, partial [Porticoccaceae bacterium]|nr:aldolase/citrate lyase family protein [Porticoccaceae bacterium]